MNTIDIELPPLPEWIQEQAGDVQYPVYTIVSAIKQYARDAIKADRQRRYLKESAQLDAEWVTIKNLQQQHEADRQRRGEPVELHGVSEALSNGDGFWRSCTGCHETNEGHATGPYSETLQCHLGIGCSECGGIGAIWDDTDYDAMGDYMARGAEAPQPAEPVKVPSDAESSIHLLTSAWVKEFGPMTNSEVDKVARLAKAMDNLHGQPAEPNAWKSSEERDITVKHSTAAGYSTAKEAVNAQLDLYRALAAGSAIQQSTEAGRGNPVGRVRTVGGYPDESTHTVEWFVKHRDIRNGDLLYTHPATPEGWQLVPKDLLERVSNLFPECMEDDGSGRVGWMPHTRETVKEFRAMLKAAPKFTTPNQEE